MSEFWYPMSIRVPMEISSEKDKVRYIYVTFNRKHKSRIDGAVTFYYEPVDHFVKYHDEASDIVRARGFRVVTKPRKEVKE